MTPSLPSTPSSRPGSGAASRPPRTPRPPAGPTRKWGAGPPPAETQIVYVSPLKALGNDIQRNLEAPLAEITEIAARQGFDLGIRTAVRTGDTPAKDRQAFVRTPPHILITTPESLYLMLTAQRSP